MITEKIKKIIIETLDRLGYEKIDFNLEHPGSVNHGDYSTNVALVIAKNSDVTPSEIAEEIKEEIEKNLLKEIERVEVAGAGFINFHLSKDFFASNTKNIIQNGVIKGGLLSGKKILFEYTDPNAFKDFHIGHLMSNAIGEALSRVAEAQGAEVKRLCYGSDIGLPVAKAVWGMQKFTLSNKSSFPQDGDALSDKVRFLSEAYVFGNSAYEEDENAKKEIKEINKKLFEGSDKELAIYYDKGRKWSLEKLDEIYLKLGTKFDKFYFESEMAEVGKKTVLDNVDNGIFESSEGAIVFKGEKYGLHTRVFLTSEGLPPYEAKELALFIKKNEDFSNHDISVVVTANEQSEYFRVVKKVISILYPETGNKLVHISHGLLRFADGKMSSRKGNIITGESLLLDTENEVYQKISDRDLSEVLKKEISEAVAVSAIKYSILRQKPGKDIIFDREKALSFEGDSGPYLQYALVRAYALLEKSKEEGVLLDATMPDDWITTEVEKMLQRFGEIMQSAWEEKAPQQLVEYLTHLASSFNSFYAQGKIVDKNDPTSAYRLAITKAFAQTLESGLHILGIKTLHKM